MSNSGECSIHMDPALAAGKYANAFRVVRDGEREWFIDFLVVSHADRAGRLVSRTRVALEMLQPLQQGLRGVLEELGVVEPQEGFQGLLGASGSLN